MNKQQLASKIWESANKMRSKIEANEYKDYILGFIFYKFLSEQEERFCKENGFTADDMKALSEEDAETVRFIQTKIGYFISYDDLFSTWIEGGNDFGIDNVRDALSAFSRLVNSTHSKVFDGIFNTLQTGLSKLGESAAAQTKAARDLIHLIGDIPMDGRQDYDVLGFIYEDLIGKFAANAGKKAGEFYTPHEVSLLMSEIVANYLCNKKEIKIYDPTSGSGSLLINIGRAVAGRNNSEDGIKYYAQELKQNTYNLTRMNLVMRGILPDNIVTRNGDTLEEDWPYFDESDPTGTYDPLYVDAVVSNPPYSQNWDPANKDVDPRYSYGLAPKSKADYAFLLHDLYHLRPEGIMTIVLPHGVLFRGGEEGKIRQNLIEHHHIEAIIGLPANIFFGTGIPTIIMVLRQKREASDILIVDASKGFAKVGTNNRLRASDIKKAVDAIVQRKDVAGYARLVSKEEVRANDYNLNIPRYVDSSEKAESWDIYASMFGGIPTAEIDELASYWGALPRLREALFEENETPYAQLKCANVKDTVLKHATVEAFENDFCSAFSDFEAFLQAELLRDPEKVVIAEEESKISADVFRRLRAVPLIDKYVAYQALDDAWQQIDIDLEIIQTEGIQAVKCVDPKMVVKKKNNKDQEVQEGWLGHILPFDLVQQTVLVAQTAALRSEETRLIEIASTYEEILDSFSEEEKEAAVVNEAGDAFIAAEVKKCVKGLSAHEKAEEESFEAKVMRVGQLLEEEKKLKATIKGSTEQLHRLTKETIEGLSDAQAMQLLKGKWIDPITSCLGELPKAVATELAVKTQALADKYQVTYSDIMTEIKDAEQSLVAMIDDLCGNEYDMRGLSELQTLLRGE
ncbi:MAG: type I restriction-modification system subunit M [Raoultibacter sp.]